MEETDSSSEEFLNYLVEIAKRDGIVSDDEKSFIDTMTKEIENYKIELKKALEDDEITQDERLRLFQIRLKILRKALDTVLKDLSVSPDEHDLLDGLKTKLSELAEKEAEFMN